MAIGISELFLGATCLLLCSTTDLNSLFPLTTASLYYTGRLNVSGCTGARTTLYSFVEQLMPLEEFARAFKYFSANKPSRDSLLLTLSLTYGSVSCSHDHTMYLYVHAYSHLCLIVDFEVPVSHVCCYSGLNICTSYYLQYFLNAYNVVY